MFDWTGHAFTAAALSIGTVVCIAASNAGTTSQDLKTSFLVGGTPWKQQTALMIGVLTSVVAIGWTLQFVNRSLREVQEAAYPVVLAVPAGAAEEQGLDGRMYPVVRVGGRSDIPDGSYLVGESGQVRYRLQPGIGSS